MKLCQVIPKMFRKIERSLFFKKFKHILIMLDLFYMFWMILSNQKRSALKNNTDLSIFQPVSFDLRPFRKKTDDVCMKSTIA